MKETNKLIEDGTIKGMTISEKMVAPITSLNFRGMLPRPPNLGDVAASMKDEDEEEKKNENLIL